MFQYINLLLPDPLNFFKIAILETIRGASASLIVGFPLFIWISSILQKDLVQDPARRELGIRKWLIYFTLLVAAIAMIIYLITLVGSFYGGELSLSFALKVLCVFAVTGVVFGYYLFDVRQTGKPGELSQQLASGSSLVVAVLLVAGIFIAGTPAEQRQVRLDSQRISDLQSIQGQIVQFWTSKGKLPTSLDQLTDSISGFVAPVDPGTKLDYDYRALGTTSFELCANFAAAATAEDLRSFGYYPTTKPVQIDESGDVVSSDLEGSWIHGVGRSCFERTIDPELYRPQTKLPTS